MLSQKSIHLKAFKEVYSTMATIVHERKQFFIFPKLEKLKLKVSQNLSLNLGRLEIFSAKNNGPRKYYNLLSDPVYYCK